MEQQGRARQSTNEVFPLRFLLTLNCAPEQINHSLTLDNRDIEQIDSRTGECCAEFFTIFASLHFVATRLPIKLLSIFAGICSVKGLSVSSSVFSKLNSSAGSRDCSEAISVHQTVLACKDPTQTVNFSCWKLLWSGWCLYYLLHS